MGWNLPSLGWPTSGPISGTESSPPRSCQWDTCTCWEGVKASFEPCQDPITLPTELGSGGRAEHCEDKSHVLLAGDNGLH